MKKWFLGLKVSQKLTLICIFFVMPDSLMLYFFITSINANIHFAQLEQQGNEYQRPLETLLELIPQDGALAVAAAGDPASRPQLARKQSQIDAAFKVLQAADDRLGAILQFTDEGLAKRHREHFRVRTVKAEWQELKDHLAQLPPAAIAAQHLQLMADLRMMITHAGDMSNLILDPQLDSYYLVDVTLLALPQTQDRLAEVMTLGEAIINRHTISSPERQQMAIYATFLQEDDLDRITDSLQTSLSENPNFYGGSASFQARVPPAFQEYASAAQRFISLSHRLVDSEKMDVTLEEYRTAGNEVRDATFKLWTIADEELDIVLQKRIEFYQHRRARSLIVAALAVLAAITFVTFITRGISRPLRQQAAELHAANETLQAEIAERKRAAQRLNIQYAISRILAESPSLKEVSAQILQTVCEKLDWVVGEMWSVDRKTAVMRFDDLWVAPHFAADDFLTVSRHTTFVRGVGLAGRVWESGLPLWIPDVIIDSLFLRGPAAKKVGLHAAFCVPILAGSEVVGALEFFSSQIRPPDEDLLRMFTVLASQLGQFYQRKRLESHLIESQKMETVGKLSGGIAHEFNSIMTAIIGHSELLLIDLAPESPLRKHAREIRRAAERAATLTRQLLAYGRKQLLRPEILNLNSILSGMENVLRHLVGNNGHISITPGPQLKMVKADAGQIEQVIINITMNAADAMPTGGTLSLETANVTLDDAYVSRFPELKAGEYVMLAITDTGLGMSDAVKTRLFEPFFSTKGVGQGTGLGLATCYGIVKQSGGHISVYSELSRGSTFRMYLPQVDAPTALPAVRVESPDLPTGTETILLVEDDPALREMSEILLTRLGYTVFTASNGVEALNLKQQRGMGHVDLLFTDVVMPHMSGKELSDRVRVLSPHTKILFTSAYMENAIVRQGVLEKGVALLQKPFTPSALARKLREVLDQPAASEPDATRKIPGPTDFPHQLSS